MQIINDPKEVQARAKAIRVPMNKICERAGVWPATFQRWKRGDLSPRLDTVERLSAALQEYEEFEQRRG